MLKLTYKLLLSFCFIITVCNAFAGEVVINGIAEDFADNEIELSYYSDFITERLIRIETVDISSDEKFSFKTQVDEITLVTLKIEDKTTKIYIEPGKVYNLKLYFDEALNKGRIYDRILSVKFMFPAPNELNLLIANFNSLYDTFIEENIVEFEKRDRSIVPKIEEFKKHALSEIEKYPNEFAKNFAIYAIASLENAIDVSYNKYTVGKDLQYSESKIFNDYLSNAKVQYNNIEYMKFFKDFFKEDFKDICLTVKGMKLTDALKKADIDGAVNALKQFKYFQNDELAQLFLLNGLYEVYFDKYFNQNKIKLILEKLSKTSSYPEQKIIAQNILFITSLQKPQKGLPAPDFTLLNVDSEQVSLKDLRGKFIYLNFFNTSSIPSIKEMKLLQLYHKKYGEKITFVSICVDNDIEKLKDFLNEYPDYKWIFLHIGKNKNVLDDYFVKTYPTYFLINEKGIFYQAPAARPAGFVDRSTETNIEQIFYKIVNNKL
ncbi:MAG: hypothetical protein Kow0079_05450 [Vicingaceae bacterium]